MDTVKEETKNKVLVVRDQVPNKKRRHRKKHLYNTILQQMEFYFSDANLSKDRFLSQLLTQENSCVNLEVFLKFNKIRKLTNNIEDLQKAIRNSQLVELTEDKCSIFRKEPVKEKANVDACTVYIEGLKSDATHTWLSSVFSEFGKVVYVSIPKYRQNGTIKGFAFVEFDTEKEAESALNYFESIGCRIPSNIEPEQLCSINTFEGSAEEQMSIDNKEESSKKRKFVIGNISDDKNESLENDNKRLKIDNYSDLQVQDDENNKKKKKLKKEHKKKNIIKELGLQVLSKKEWKKMRNKYLDLQKKKMQEFKKYLLKSRFGQTNYDKPSSHHLEVTNTTKEKNASKLKFTEGVIVKIELTEPPADIKKLKNDIKSCNSDVKYVDIPNPASETVFVRFSDNKNASDFCKLESSGKKTILEKEEEVEYWNKIHEDHKQKVKKLTKKQRGRDKLVKKAKHIKFDE